MAHFFTDLIDIFERWNDVEDTVRNTCPTRELKRIDEMRNVPLFRQKHTSARASAEKGVSGGGFTTAVQPAAKAAPSFRVIIADGKFHGVRIDLGSL